MAKAQLKEDNNKLSDVEDWSKRWEEQTDLNKDISFDPNHISFRDIHQKFSCILKEENGAKDALEIGAFPGSYLWYFNHFFGYKAHGVEYVDWCCEATKHYMKQQGKDVVMHHADFFEFEATQKYDLVSSFGFVEHFEDTKDVVLRHATLVKKDGYVVITIPNHAYIYGSLLKWIDKEKYGIHNLMSYERLVAPILEDDRLELIDGGYAGHLGFWNSGLYTKLEEISPLLRKVLRIPLRAIEHLGHYLIPNNKITSPVSYIVVKVSEEIEL